ncbi:phosphatidylinositol-specific phospholipase C domain-containing protein [Limibacter armeniacum]|uniref:phosphatidylinositol-specific phospholipase C domain-containing protein n=1 Tax=Limibacter armeniacum TaxID=466084 RepID=UPI002FE56257
MENLSIIYKGAHSNNLYTAYYDGAKWHGDTPISDEPGGISPESNYNPGTVVFNNWLYLIYKGANSNELYSSWYNGTKWSGNIKISDQLGNINPESNYCPNAVVYKGLLFIVYKDPHSNDLYSAWFNGTTWYGNTKISDQPGGISPESNYNPGMVVYNNRLYIIYKDAHSDELFTAYFDGSAWYGNTKISDQPGDIDPESNYSPGTAVFDNKLYLVYKGAHSNELFTAYFNGTTWYGNTKINDQPGDIDPESNYSPNAEVFDNDLWIVYKGAHSDELFTAYFNGTTWYGNTKINDQPGDIDPESNYNPSVCTAAISPNSQARWMERLTDSTLISAINIPGSHDAAAINTSITTPYACHNYSISDQLEFGIRLLDVRIKVEEKNGSYTFTTCHSDIGLGIGMNTYQSLVSLLDECTAFLHTNPSEVVLMSLKVDDWSNTTDKSQAETALTELVNQYPISSSESIPSLGSVRGRIFLYNRINTHLSLGVPIHWSNNTAGSYADNVTHRRYQVYVQDKYEELSTFGPQAEKFELVTLAFSNKQEDEVVWNFASATWFGFGVYIMGDLLNYFGANEANNRLAKFGWTLFDFPFNSYNTNIYSAMSIVSLIIDSNFGYSNYPDKFKVVNDGHDSSI